MKNHGLTSVSALLGDMLVYRNLQPLDERLPGFSQMAADLGTPACPIPRKSEPDYARIMVALLQRARALEAPTTTLRRLIYVGDTRMNDGAAFKNLCRAGHWPGIAFIGSEGRDAAHVDLLTEGETTLYLANRWTMIADFDRYCADHGFPIDEETAIVLDLDKTLLGARGRNDHVIDKARVEAVRQTVAELLGDTFDATRFEAAYGLLNRTEFHPFTTDNQDYLAYLCLIVGSDLYSLDALVDDVRNGRMQTFGQFLEDVETRSAELPERLQALHQDIYNRVKAGDATPFKAFRYNEYQSTVRRMGQLEPEARVSALLAHEIVITEEVRNIALGWHAQGALLFGLSDKPDEASIPTEALAALGYRPIHRTPTHAVGNGSLALPSLDPRS